MLYKLNLAVQRSTFLPKRPKAQEQDCPYRMSTVLTHQSAWSGIDGKLRAKSGCQVRDEVNIPLIASCISLQAADDAFLKIRRFQPILEQQLIRSIGVLDASPNIVPLRKSKRRFR